MDVKKRVLRGFVGKTAYRFFFWLIADLRGKHDELQEYRGGKVLQQVGFQMIYNTFLLWFINVINPISHKSTKNPLFKIQASLFDYHHHCGFGGNLSGYKIFVSAGTYKSNLLHRSFWYGRPRYPAFADRESLVFCDRFLHGSDWADCLFIVASEQ